jgi:hypothetical protein
MALTDQELLAQIADLSKLDPAQNPSKYMRSTSTSKGTGKRATTSQSQELDKEAFQKAKDEFAQTTAGRQLNELQTEWGSRQNYAHSLLGQIAAPASYFGEVPGAFAGAATTPRGTVAPMGTTMTGRAATLLPYLVRAGIPALTAAGAYMASEDPHHTQAERDAFRGAATTLAGVSTYPLVHGIHNAYSTIGRPVEGTASPEGGTLAEVPPTPSEPPINVKGMNTKKAAEEIVRRLGATPAPTLPENRSLILGAYSNANPEVKAALAAGHPKLESLKTITEGLKAPWNAKFMGPLALVTGAGAALLGGTNPADALPQSPEESTPHYLARRAFPYVSAVAPELDPRTYRAAGELGAEAAHALREPPAPERVMPLSRMERLHNTLANDPAERLAAAREQDIAEAPGDYFPGGGPRELRQQHANTNLRQAYLEEARQREELEDQLAGGSGSRVGPLPPSSLEAATGFAKGGKVGGPSLRGMELKLSAMQRELQSALSRTAKQAEALGRNKTTPGSEKAHGHKKDLIDDIWALHELSKKIMGGQLCLNPGISKKELIELARKHGTSAASAA